MGFHSNLENKWILIEKFVISKSHFIGETLYCICRKLLRRYIQIGDFRRAPEILSRSSNRIRTKFIRWHSCIDYFGLGDSIIQNVFCLHGIVG